MKNQTQVEVLNDINGELVNMYRVVKHHLEEFVRQFRWALTSRDIYKWLQITPEETLTDIQRAARFYYLQKLAFGGKVADQNFGTATTSAPRLNLLRLEEEHLRPVVVDGSPVRGVRDFRTDVIKDEEGIVVPKEMMIFVDLEDGRILCRGLSMPHSPRWRCWERRFWSAATAIIWAALQSGIRGRRLPRLRLDRAIWG